MKRFYTKNLLVKLSGIFILVLAVIIIHSCKKDNTSQKDQDSSISDINMLKVWYQATYPKISSNLKVESTTLTKDWSKTLSPYWDKASSFVSNGKTFFELPALKKGGNMAMSFSHVNADQFDFTHTSSISSFIAVKQPSTYHVYVMTIIADSAYLQGDYSKLAKNTYRNRDAHFSGLVLYHRMDGSFVNGWHYKDGKIIAAINTSQTATTPGIQNASRLAINENAAPNPDDCGGTLVTQYWESCEYFDDDVNESYPMNCYDYSTETYYPDECSVGGGDAGTGGGGGSAGGVNDSSGNKDDDQDIIDSLAAYPCAQSVVRSIPGLKDTIANLINKTFGNNADINLIFRVDNSIIGNEDGEVDKNLSSANYTAASGVSGNIVIDLNPTMLGTATKEYMLATFYHEALHGIITILQLQLGSNFSTQYPSIKQYNTTDANGNPIVETVLDQHSVMAANFLTPLANSIQSMNANFTPAYAMAMAQCGIIDSSANTAINYAERNDTSDAKGTKCPPSVPN